LQGCGAKNIYITSYYKSLFGTTHDDSIRLDEERRNDLRCQKRKIGYLWRIFGGGSEKSNFPDGT
jgi:hypothetical protein